MKPKTELGSLGLLEQIEFLLQLQGEDNVLVLQSEFIVRLVLKIHENDTNII